MLRVTSVLGNSQKLDGGAMFGNVPRALWQRWLPPDELGRVSLACRGFLVEDGERRMLIETGVGAFFPPKLKQRYGVVEDEHVLLDSLRAVGVEPGDIDVVLLSHLHFDHAGGLLSRYRDQEPLELAFPRARFVVGERAFARATQPHRRDRASFIAELPQLLKQSGRLVLVPEQAEQHPACGARIRLFRSEGHTPGMLLPLLVGEQRSALFCADLVPGIPWMHLPVTMGYDRFPERLIDEKHGHYQRGGRGLWMLLTHDPHVAAASLSMSEAGKYGPGERLESLHAWDLDQAA